MEKYQMTNTRRLATLDFMLCAQSSDRKVRKVDNQSLLLCFINWLVKIKVHMIFTCRRKKNTHTHINIYIYIYYI